MQGAFARKSPRSGHFLVTTKTSYFKYVAPTKLKIVYCAIFVLGTVQFYGYVYVEMEIYGISASPSEFFSL